MTLVDALRDETKGIVDAVEIAGWALLSCRRASKELLVAWSRFEGWIFQEAPEFAKELKGRVADSFGAEDRRWLADEVDRCCSELGERGLSADQSQVVAARMLAESLDQAFGRQYHLSFRRRFVEVEEGTPLPLAAPNWPKIFGRGLSAEPRRLGPPLDRTHHLVLAKEPPSGLRVIFDSSFADHFPELTGSTRLGIITPFSSNGEHEWQTYEEDGQALLFGVRPKSEQLLGRVVKATMAAVEDGCALVLAPELCLDLAYTDTLEAELRSKRSTAIVGCGSYHHDKSNIARVVFGHSRKFEHRKFNRVEMGADKRVEDLHLDKPGITVLFSERWSLCVLVCKDFLFEGVIDYLGHLRVSCIMVVAMTDRFAEFKTRAEQYACAAQAIVMIANTPGPRDSGTIPLALVARPYRDSTRRLFVRVYGECEGRHYLWIELGGTEAS